MPYNKIYIQNNLQELRKSYHMRQVDLARMLGFKNEERLSQWEHGGAMPGAINLIKLCILYNVTPKSLYPELYKEIESCLNSRVDKAIEKVNEETRSVLNGREVAHTAPIMSSNSESNSCFEI